MNVNSFVPDSLKKSFSKIQSADKVVIGLSGGADSVALTHILFNVFGNEKLICAHVNHGIRGEEAKRDELFARAYANSLGIRFELLECDIPKLSAEKHIGTEEAGRLMRYSFFEELADTDSSVICTAHNADDNAETVLMNISRGTGLKGVSGIPLVRGKVLRPLLSMTRAEVEKYCSDNSLDFVTDSTNLTDEYSRNIFRHRIITELVAFNPSAVQNILRLSELAAADNTYLDAQANSLLEKSNSKWGIYAAKLSDAEDVILSRALRIMAKSKEHPEPTSIHIDKMIDVVRRGGSVDIPGNRRFYNSQGTLLIISREACKFADEQLLLGKSYSRYGRTLDVTELLPKNSTKIHKLVFNNLADYDKIKHSVIVSSRRSGDSFTFSKRKLTKSLKKIMTEERIPEPLRDSIFILRDGERIIYVEGIGVSAEYSVQADTKRILCINNS